MSKKRMCDDAAHTCAESIKKVCKSEYPFRSTPLVVDLQTPRCIHKDGFTVLKNIFASSSELVSELKRQICDKETESIFNHGDGVQRRSMLKFDGLRQQRKLNFEHSTVQDMFEKVQQRLSTILPTHTMRDGVVLFSKVGCGVQAAHADYAPTAQMAVAPDSLQPFGALIAVQEGTKLYVWPGSNRLSTIREDFLSQIEPIDPLVVLLNPGDVLLFAGSLVHAGAEYSSADNVRVHFYVDSPAVAREDNETMLVRGEPNGRRQMCKLYQSKIKF